MIINKRRAGQYGAEFDGSTDDLVRGADLTGNADSKVGIFSACIYFDATGSDEYIWSSENQFAISKGATNVITILGKNSAGTPILSLTNVSSIPAGAYIHVLASWDLATAAAHFYIDDVDDLDGATLTNDTIDYTRSNHWLGSLLSALFYVNGRVSEFYLNTAEYIDFSVEANRRKFIKASGKPAMLGGNGERPTGNQPIVYLNKRFNEFQRNKGYGGNFTVNGSLAYEKGPLHD